MSHDQAFPVITVGILLVGLLGEWLFHRTGIPDAVWLIAVGAGLGPVSSLVRSDQLQGVAPLLGALTIIIVSTSAHPRVIMELMRHSDLRLSSTAYTDATCLPLFAEIGKLDSFLPSPIASPKSDKNSQEQGKPVRSGLPATITEVVVLQRENPLSSSPVQTWDAVKMAERLVL